MKNPLSLLGVLFGSALGAVAADVPAVTPVDAARLVAAGQAVLIDVREPAEWAATGVAAGAVLLPKSDFDGAQKLWADFLAKNRGQELILYCHSGRRAGIVGAALAAQGFKVANAGGFKDWTAAGLPTRQVESVKP
jgi:rhodanese-related sulfurtransferase